MNSHIIMCAKANSLKMVTLLYLTLAFSVILIALVHFSLSTDTADTTTPTQYNPNEKVNPGLEFKESTGSMTNNETFFNLPEQHDQIIGGQPDNASCPDAIDSTGSRGQVSNVPGNENVSLSTPLPDGRIFTSGEPPYGYLPTCSPKDGIIPFVPVEPD